MKKIILMTAVFFSQLVLSQSKFETISLSNWGTIRMPESLEVQSGIYKKVLDESKKHFSVNAERVVLQQKGVNNGNNLNTYARVIIRKETGFQKLPDLDREIISTQDLNDLNDMYKSEIMEVANNPRFPAKIIKWNKLQIKTLNGKKCIHYSYVRQMGTNPQTHSEFYIFWRGNQQYSFNIEYRVNESNKWKSDLESSIQTIKIF